MIGRDEDVFHHPEDFDPMRWIVEESDEDTGRTKMKLRSDIKTVGFGFGRVRPSHIFSGYRVCLLEEICREFVRVCTWRTSE